MKTSYIWPYTLPYGDPRHGGTGTGYVYYQCRCPECVSAWTQRRADRRTFKANRLASDPTLAPHGVANTYTNWGCRCAPCTAANTDKSRRRAVS